MKRLKKLGGGLVERVGRRLNDLSLRKKRRVLYYFCILGPIILTDAVILVSLIRAERFEQAREMADVASAIQYSVTSFTETPSVIARTIYLDTSVREFLETVKREKISYSDWIVHPVTNFGTTTFSRKWLPALDGRVIRRDA